MGIAPFNISSSVILITAQRLARKLCASKRPLEIPEEALLRAGYTEEELEDSWQPYGPVGCEVCKNTGYKGRVGVYQVMPVSEEIQRIIMKNGTAIDVADQARQDGVRDLRQSGLLKVKRGLTSLEEIEAVTNE
jgi:type IV pilus assembly protein PilB